MHNIVIRENIAAHMAELKAWLAETADAPLEQMTDFFHARLEGYEPHMLQSWEEAYCKMPDFIPENAATLLDLGCGTGLELDAILKRYPKLHVTGIDLSQEMLRILQQKHPAVRTVCADYFKIPLGEACYDAVISFESLHHFAPAEKEALFAKIFRALKPGGRFVETDYIACCREEETLLFETAAQKRKAKGIPPETLVHFDTPLTLEHETALISAAGFHSVEPICCINGACTVMALK